MHSTILISGASQGIGLALSKHFLNQGYHVIGTSRTGEIKEITHDNFTDIALDLSSDQSIYDCGTYFKNNGVYIDMLINNAGIGPDLNYAKPEANSYRKTFEVNTTGTVLFTEAMLPYLKDHGRIINISSKMGSISMCTASCSVAYRMSKTALNMYTKILANRLQGKHVVTAVHPGWVRTMISGDDSSGRLSPEESATGIFDYITGDFENGSFWNVETQSYISW